MAADQSVWSSKEEDAIFEACFLSGETRIQDLSKKLKRDTVEIAYHLLNDTDIPEMAGWGDERCPDQDAEFLGLALSGVPMAMALQWCAVISSLDARPTRDQLTSSMTSTDLRPATELACCLGIWLTKSSQLSALQFLTTQPMLSVQKSINAVIDRVDAPTPEIIAQQLFGALPKEGPVCWAAMAAKNECPKSTFGRSTYTKKKTSARKYYARKTYASKKRYARG
jgi:hypothetical protein